MKIFKQEKKWLLKEKYGLENINDLKGGKSEAFSADCQRLKKGEPLAFVIGFVEFLNCKIDLEFKPLIPRPETEFWVDEFIKNELKLGRNLAKPNSAPQILDIFAGSGCIGISILKNNKVLPHCLVDFAEINTNFIKQIKKNIKLNNLKHKNFKIFQSDIFKNIPKNRKYDYILANPPYIPKNKIIESSVFDFEDYNSLFAKDNGLYFIKKTILNGLEKLKNNGKIYIEFDENSKTEIETFLKSKKIENYQFKKDQFKNNRLLIIYK